MTTNQRIDAHDPKSDATPEAERSPPRVVKAPPANTRPTPFLEDASRPSLTRRAIAGHDCRGAERTRRERDGVIQIESASANAKTATPVVFDERGTGTRQRRRRCQHRLRPDAEVAEALRNGPRRRVRRVQDEVEHGVVHASRSLDFRDVERVPRLTPLCTWIPGADPEELHAYAPSASASIAAITRATPESSSTSTGRAPRWALNDSSHTSATSRG